MKIAILGYGAMGKVIESAIAKKDDMECTATIEPAKGESLSEVTADAVIDFSNPANLDMLYDFCSNTGCGAVIATTGFDENQKKKITDLSSKVPVVFASNFSLGITVMKKVLEDITPILRDDFDMEIIEKHHNKKLDAPSGTAIALLSAMDPDNSYQHIYGRHGNRKREKEIGIHALRGGTIAGEHTAIYAGNDEILEIKHTAGSKKIFAAGALKAAEFISAKGPGLYDMSDVLFK